MQKVVFENARKNILATIIENAGQYTIQKGSKIAPAGASLRNLADTRNNNTGVDNVTTADITLKSLSAVATVISGAQANGKVYFKNTALVTGAATAASTAPVTVSVPKVIGAQTEEKAEEAEAGNNKTEEKTEQESKAEPTPAPKEEETEKPTLSEKEKKARKTLSDDITRIGNDWQFCIDTRMKDTLARVADRAQYLISIAELEGYDDVLINVCKDKLNSAEFQDIEERLNALKLVNAPVNKRLTCYYGDTGTGKTINAIRENPGAVKVVASANDKPSEMFTTYSPTENKYILTELGKCMEQGKTYILDEGNLLPVQCWQRLQGILDNTNSITDRGITIKIADGFRIVTTMNLETNCGKRPLPSPIVSRCAVIKKFENVKTDPTEYIW